MALYSCYVQLPYHPFHLSHVTDTQQLVDCLGSMSVVETLHWENATMSAQVLRVNYVWCTEQGSTFPMLSSSSTFFQRQKSTGSSEASTEKNHS